MSRRTSLSMRVLLAASAAFLVSFDTLSAQAKLGFVDMEKVLDAHPRKKQLEEMMKNELSARLDQLKMQAEKIRGSETGLEVFQEGTSEWVAKLQQIKKDKAGLEIEGKIIRADLQIKMVTAMKQMYDEARVIVTVIAKENGLAGVAMTTDSSLKGNTRAELISDIVTRTFVYRDENLDITAEVIKRLTK